MSFIENKKWVVYITDIFLPLISSENGDFIHLPFEGGLMEQPYMTMSCLRLLQLNYRKYLSESMKKIQKKGKK